MQNRSGQCLIIALTMLITSICVAEQMKQEKRLSDGEFFGHVQNRIWKGELSVGGKVERFRLRTEVKRPCDACGTKALHLVFDFKGPFEFPPDFRTSDGGFNTVVRSATEIAILSGMQCEGPDVGPLQDEIGLSACTRMLIDSDTIEYVLKLVVSRFSYYQRFFGPRKTMPQRLLPSRMTCDFIEARNRIQGGVTYYDMTGLKHLIQFSLWEESLSDPR